MTEISDLKRDAPQASTSQAAMPVKSNDFAATVDSGFLGYCAHGLAAHYAPSQHPDWIAAWDRAVRPDGFVLTLHKGVQVLARLALETEKLGPVRVARFVGNSHANGNFPALPTETPTIDRNLIPAICDAVRSARPDIDVIRLERMVAQFGGVTNPLVVDAATLNPNVRLALDLSPGFDAILSTWSSKRLKRHRYRARKFNEAGGYRRIVALSQADVERLLAAFFQMKEARFKALGIDDPFASPEVRAFFHDLFTVSLGNRAYTLEALEIGGIIRAVSAHSRAPERVVCDFVGFAEDELTPHSPGEFLFYLNIQDAAASGVTTYDFGTGDEPYKRAWCNSEALQFDLVIPLNARGSAFAAWLRLRSRLVSGLKRNQRIWTLAKKARRKLRGA